MASLPGTMHLAPSEKAEIEMVDHARNPAPICK